MDATQKYVELEAVRGVAAIVVMFGHSLHAFAPTFHGMWDENSPAFALFGTPAYAFANGSGAVILFFVLSGFVLTVSMMRSGEIHALPLAMAKRWPRLVVPVLAVNLVAGLLMAFGLYATAAIGREAGSVWITWNYGWPSKGLSEIWKAAVEGAVTTFTHGSASYNSNLWTMHYELIGSMIALGCVPLYVISRSSFVFAVGMMIAWLAATAVNAYYGCFVAGAVIAALYNRHPQFPWTPLTTAIALTTLLVLFGFQTRIVSTNDPAGLYSFLTPIVRLCPHNFRVCVHTFASCALIYFVLTHTPSKRLLGGRIGYSLGRFSFPIYLTHIPVICSAAAYVFLACGDLPYIWRAAFAIVCTFVLSYATAIPIVALDQWWIKRLKVATARSF